MQVQVQVYCNIPVDSKIKCSTLPGTCAIHTLILSLSHLIRLPRNQQEITNNAIGKEIRNLFPLTYFSYHFSLQYTYLTSYGQDSSRRHSVTFFQFKWKKKLFHNFCERFSSTSVPINSIQWLYCCYMRSDGQNGRPRAKWVRQANEPKKCENHDFNNEFRKLAPWWPRFKDFYFMVY